MKVKKWLEQLEDRPNQEEIGHLDIRKAIIKIQFKNPITKTIELQELGYTAKNADNIKKG